MTDAKDSVHAAFQERRQKGSQEKPQNTNPSKVKDVQGILRHSRYMQEIPEGVRAIFRREGFGICDKNATRSRKGGSPKCLR